MPFAFSNTVSFKLMVFGERTMFTKVVFLDGKARAGLMQWLNVESALDAFVLANHATVPTSSKRSLNVINLDD